jgi:hypothetical protein
MALSNVDLLCVSGTILNLNPKVIVPELSTLKAQSHILLMMIVTRTC